MSLCLMMLLTGCATVKTEYVYMPIPASLTQENPIPHVPAKMIWGQCPALYIQAVHELKQCNADKRVIKNLLH